MMERLVDLRDSVDNDSTNFCSDDAISGFSTNFMATNFKKWRILLKQHNRANRAIPMQLIAVIVFAIPPNTMSWLHPKSRDKMSGLGVND